MSEASTNNDSALSTQHSALREDSALSTRHSALSPELQARFRILKILADEPDLSQRELARRLGISLGKSNYLLKALVEKGLLKIGNFRRAERKLKYVYLLTPAGIRERIRLTSAYLARKEAEYDALTAEIAELRGEPRGASNGGKSE